MGQLNLDSERPPIFTGAGVVKSAEGIRQIADMPEVALQIPGSYTWREWGGNRAGRNVRVEHWDEETQSYYNAIGLEGPGVENASRYMPDCMQYVHDKGQRAIISGSTLPNEDPRVMLPRLAVWAAQMGADGFEANTSCPNIKDHGLLCEDPDETYEVMGRVRSEVGDDFYLSLKVSDLAPYLIRRYRTEGELPVDAIDTINSVGKQPSPLNPETGKPYIEVNDGLAGKSGPSIRDLARENLQLWAGQEFDVLSIGGVNNGHEVRWRIGARALLAGGTQAFRRAANPAQVAQKWAKEYSNL